MFLMFNIESLSQFAAFIISFTPTPSFDTSVIARFALACYLIIHCVVNLQIFDFSR